MKQHEALDILKLGHNVYLTGSAGTGKTFLLNQYIEFLKNKGVGVGITASTGIAATHLKGVTIHSWSGLGIRENLSKNDLQELSQKRYLARRFAETQVLIIDEVSMLHSFHLDLVDRVCQAFKNNQLPFGGLQVILCGDFFQLPPVSKNGQKPQFITASLAWNNMNLKICYLEEQYRHQDSELVKILNEIRENRAGDQTRQLLRAKAGGQAVNSSNLTKLYTHNLDVDYINNQELAKLPGKTHLYPMQARGFKPLVEVLKNSCLAPAKLFLKKGSLVMFVKNNFEQGYVNGTLGRVAGFDESGLPVVETLNRKKIVAAPTSWLIEEEGRVKAEIVQLPLRLAWAITVHKSQGMSLDAAEIDLSKSFEKGMGYVALSRVRSLAGIKLKGINELALQVNEEVLELDKKLQAISQQAVVELAKLNQQDKQRQQAEFLRSIAPPEDERKKRPKKVPGATREETKILISKRLSIKEIAQRRGLTQGTILSHLEKLVERGAELDLEHLRPPAGRFAKMERAFEESGDFSLSPVREILGEDYSYDELRLARLFLQMEETEENSLESDFEDDDDLESNPEYRKWVEDQEMKMMLEDLERGD